LNFDLLVIHPFGRYTKDRKIRNDDEIAKVLNDPASAGNVVKIPIGSNPKLLSTFSYTKRFADEY